MAASIVQDDIEKETQLFIDGAYVAGWAQFDIPEELVGRLSNMMSQAFDEGKQAKTEEIRKVLGCK